jgi:hypothetical protein
MAASMVESLGASSTRPSAHDLQIRRGATVVAEHEKAIRVLLVRVVDLESITT